MSQALYRKYRSRSLADIVGQEHITETLARALAAGRISHAYLFTGPRGVGKTSVARILAHEINKLPYSDTTQLDIIEIDAASNRRIDDIRDLREKVHIAPVSAPYKVYIIDEVHMLTGESFNALLKTLEEPPSHVVFILATTEAHKLPATIISRTQRFAFRPAGKEKVVNLLRDIATKEKVSITDDALSLIAEHGDGSFRDSVSLLDQMSHIAEGEITAEKVTQTLGLAPREVLDTLLEALLAGNRAAALQTLTQLENDGGAVAALAGQLNHVLAARAPENPALYGLLDKLLDVPRAYNPRLKLLTVLMSFLPPQPPPMPIPKPKVDKKSAPVVASQPHAVTITKDEVNETEDTEVEPRQRLDSLGKEEWNKVLTALKKTNAPLHAVLKYATLDFDIDAQELHLGFKYQLHRKKLDDPKQKAALVAVMRAVLGNAPVIKTGAPSKKPADPAVASVAEIMGGGEVIDPEQ
jgi:DNA polymerase III subunit gamma/tau